jgi:hypothetical protein
MQAMANEQAKREAPPRRPPLPQEQSLSLSLLSLSPLPKPMPSLLTKPSKLNPCPNLIKPEIVYRLDDTQYISYIVYRLDDTQYISYIVYRLYIFHIYIYMLTEIISQSQRGLQYIYLYLYFMRVCVYIYACVWMYVCIYAD